LAVRRRRQRATGAVADCAALRKQRWEWDCPNVCPAQPGRTGWDRPDAPTAQCSRREWRLAAAATATARHQLRSAAPHSLPRPEQQLAVAHQDFAERSRTSDCPARKELYQNPYTSMVAN